MATSESPKKTVETPASHEVARPLFSGELERVRTVLGPEQKSLPLVYGEEDLDSAERALTQDNVFESFAEQFLSSELRYRRGAVERQAVLNDGTATPEDRAEFITVSQAVTYHEYFPLIIREIAEVMTRYESLRSTMTDVPLEILQGEKQAALYLAALDAAMRERVTFANVLLAEGKLERKVGDPAALQKRLASYTSSADLSPESQTVLRGSTEEKWIRGNALNQRIIEIIAGTATLPGVEDGFLPQNLYLQLLQRRYEQLLELEKQAARDPSQSAARERFAILSRKNGEARAGRGQALDSAEAAEYGELQARFADQNAYMDSLASRRKEIIVESVELSDRLGNHQMQKLELTAVQHQFGDRFDFAGVRPPVKDTTPADIARDMGEHMERRRQFHAERLQAFVHTLDEDVLKVGMMEITEDVWNEKGREIVKDLSHGMAWLYTCWIPETFGLRERVRTSLSGPLNEAMGWPAGKETWAELTPEERQEVQEKAKSVLDAIHAFNATKLVSLRDSLTVMQALPPASTYAGQNVQEPLPPDRVTPANCDALIGQYNGATVYMMALRQMQEDWGEVEPPSGLIGEYGTFLTSVNETIDVHVDVGNALFQQQEAWEQLMKYIIAAAIAGFGAGIVATVLAYKGGKALIRGTARAVWQGGKLTARGAVSLTRSTGAQLGKLAQAVRTGSAAASGAAAAEKAAEGTARASKVGRVLGPLGIVLVGADLRRVLMRDARLGPLGEYDGIQAAIELMRNGRIVNTSVPSYRSEVQALQRRMDCLLMQQNALRILWAIERRKNDLSGEGKTQAGVLQDRCTEVEKYARRQKQGFEKRFPVTDYLVTDPKKPAGNVGIDVHAIDQARRRGQAYEDQMRLLDGMHRQQKLDGSEGVEGKHDLTQFDQLKDEHDQLLDDAAAFLETL